MIDITFGRMDLPKSGALALLLGEDEAHTGLAAALDAALTGGLTRALAAAAFKGKRGQSAMLLAPGAGLDRVIAIGIGKSDELTAHHAEAAGASRRRTHERRNRRHRR